MKRILKKYRGFTLIELITVITIIVILAGLILSVAGYVQRKGATSRAQAEIKAMEAALESYKADNGAYPDDGTTSGSNTYVGGVCANLDAKKMGNPTAASIAGLSGTTSYSGASVILYRALSGDTNCDGSVNVADESVSLSGSSQSSTNIIPTVYMPFTPGQLKTATGSTIISASNMVTAIADPFGYSYGYSTAYNGDIQTSGTATHGYNPTYDLWSTTGNLTNPPSGTDTVTPTWITNW